MPQPANMTDAELDALLIELSGRRRDASDTRRRVIGRIVDTILDEVNARKESAWIPSS